MLVLLRGHFTFCFPLWFIIHEGFIQQKSCSIVLLFAMHGTKNNVAKVSFLSVCPFHRRQKSYHNFIFVAAGPPKKVSLSLFSVLSNPHRRSYKYQGRIPSRKSAGHEFSLQVWNMVSCGQGNLVSSRLFVFFLARIHAKYTEAFCNKNSHYSTPEIAKEKTILQLHHLFQFLESPEFLFFSTSQFSCWQNRKKGSRKSNHRWPPGNDFHGFFFSVSCQWEMGIYGAQS